MAEKGYFVLDIEYSTNTLLKEEKDLKNLNSLLTARLYKLLKKNKKLVYSFEVTSVEVNQTSIL